MLGILADMEKFDTIKGIAAPMLASDGNQFSMMINIDTCLLYTSPSPRDRTRSRMPSSA